MFHLLNSYSLLSENFYEHISPSPVSNPKLIKFNEQLYRELGGTAAIPEELELARVFSGNVPLPGSEPLALAYAGHQFGNFVPQLGDGRAILLGSVMDSSGTLRDLQLKGAGPTRFSRNGDGRATLSSVIREYVLSEAMSSLGVPTTRALAMVATGDRVFRESPFPGAILTRVASNFVRVGSFEYFAARSDWESVKTLTNFVIDRHAPWLKGSSNPALTLLENTMKVQASLLSRWMLLGFIHGVMNTDNMTISGETIDYGPCAFMDFYHPSTVYSAIDVGGRYAYSNQPLIAQWNLAALANAFFPLIHEDHEKAQTLAHEVIGRFEQVYLDLWNEGMARKLGLRNPLEGGPKESRPDKCSSSTSSSANEEKLIADLFSILEKHRIDYTLFLRRLSDRIPGLDRTSRNQGSSIFDLFREKTEIEAWLAQWVTHFQDISKKANLSELRRQEMNRVNPAVIPRNHQVARVIAAALENSDYTPMNELISVLSHPYEEPPAHLQSYTLSPRPEEIVHQTFCGT